MMQLFVFEYTNEDDKDYDFIIAEESLTDEQLKDMAYEHLGSFQDEDGDARDWYTVTRVYSPTQNLGYNIVKKS